jgi:type I restriction enzyme M protein
MATFSLARRDRVLFINAVNEVTRERSQSFLTSDHRERIVAAFRDFKDEDGFCRLATRDEIRANHANLNIPLYVRTNGNGKAVTRETLARAIAEWRGASLQLRLSLNGLIAKLEEREIVQNQDGR